MNRQLLTQRLLIALTAACIGAAMAGRLATSAQASANQAPIIPIAQTSGSICGNNVCEPGETCAGCTHDCCPENETTDQPPAQNCDPNVPCDNDGFCDAPCENTFTCGDCPGFCGDNKCDPGEPNTCCGAGKDCTLAITCGTDGVCSACENAQNCPQDCTGVTTEPTTELAPTTEVPTRTPTRPAITVTKGSGVTNTSTSTTTNTPRPTSTGTVTATFTPTVTSTPPPPPAEGCSLVPYESRPASWQGAYQTAENPKGFVPDQPDNQEVWVCPVPPTGDKLCIPVYNKLLDVTNSDLKNIKLTDCREDGTCQTFDQVPTLDGDQLCFVIGVAATNPGCEVGCALLPDKSDNFPWWLIALMALLLLLAAIFLLMRRRREEREDGDAYEGVVTRTGPPSGSTTPTAQHPIPSPGGSRRGSTEPTLIEQSDDDDTPDTMYIPPNPPPTEPH